MANLELKDSLLDLKLLEISDLQRFKTAITNGSQTGFSYYFPSLLALNRHDRIIMLLEEINNSICIYRWKHAGDKPRLDLYAGPAPMTAEVLQHCIQRANDYNGNYSARILNIDSKDYTAITSQSFLKFKERRTQSLYTPRSFDDLRDDKFIILRRNVAAIQEYDNVEVLPYSQQYRKSCLALLQRWRSHHRVKSGNNMAIGNTKNFLKLTAAFVSPDILGEVIFIDNKMVAFSLGGEIRPGYAVLLEAICDPDIPGLSDFQRYRFISNLTQYDQVIDGSDMGRDGLAQMKHNLQPSAKHTEYYGVQREYRKTLSSGTRVRRPDSESNESMNSPILSGSLIGLKILQNSDLTQYQAALEEGAQMGWAYYFPYLLIRNKEGRSSTLFVEDAGSICVFLWQIVGNKPRLDLLMAPVPMNPSVLNRCIERANEFNHDYSARILRIDEKDTDTVKDAGIHVRVRKKQYIYAPTNYNQLSGKKYYTIRRNVAFIDRLADVEVIPYSKSYSEDCQNLLKRWGKLHRKNHGTSGGVGISRRTIDLAGSLPESVLRGQVIFIRGQLAAFAFGGEIRSGFACSFERKCDTQVRGLSYFQLRNFLCSFDENTLVNDGSDAGSTGLRQLKDSFRPIYIHTEYRGNQRRAMT